MVTRNGARFVCGDEPGAGQLACTVLIAAPVLLETAIVLERRAGRASGLTEFLQKANAQIVSFDEQHYRAALSAFLRFGKGRHPARLNILDCMAYATAYVA